MSFQQNKIIQNSKSLILLIHLSFIQACLLYLSCGLVVATLASDVADAPLEVAVVVGLDEGPHGADGGVLAVAAVPVAALGAGVE